MRKLLIALLSLISVSVIACNADSGNQASLKQSSESLSSDTSADSAINREIKHSLQLESFAEIELAKNRPTWEELTATEKKILRNIQVKYHGHGKALARAQADGNDVSRISAEKLKAKYENALDPWRKNVLTGEPMRTDAEEFSPGDMDVDLLTDEQLDKYFEMAPITPVSRCPVDGVHVTVYGPDRVILDTVVTVIASEEASKCIDELFGYN